MSQMSNQSLLQHHVGRSSISPEVAWSNLQGGIEEILQHKPMNKKRYLDMYNLVYQYCTSCSVAKADENYRDRELRSTEFLGRQLYNSLCDFLRNYLQTKSKEGSDKSDESILLYYYDNWKYYTFSSQVIHNIFLYLNRHWVRRELEDGNKTVYEIYSLSLVSWRDSFLKIIQSIVTAAFLHMIECERNGKTIESKYITTIVQSYVELGVENSASNRGRILTFYKQNFEKIFIQETEVYYQKESSDFLGKHTVTEYVSKADTRLTEEKGRAERLLHESTMSPLIALCEKVLIAQYLARFYDELQALLNRESIDDVGRMYKLVSRVKESLEPMKRIVQAHITRIGLSSIEAVKDKALAEPQLYARELLRIHTTYKAMVVRAFNNDALFVQALDEACAKFINDNAVIKQTKNRNKTSELLARYSDLLLKKTSKLTEEEAELEDVLQQIVVLLRYVDDKDVFNKYYMLKLSKRLIDHLSISEEAERSMITKLKEAFGNTYTSKLEKMFQDIELSKGLNERFQQRLQTSSTKLDVEFSIQVLTQGHWPYSLSDNLALPAELDVCLQRFVQFYSAEHSGRKLAWNYTQASGDVVGNFKKKYTFNVSTFQMVVLLQFNHFSTRTLEQLRDNTQIQMEYLQQVIRTLLKMKLLVGEGIPPNESEPIPESATLSVYKDFQHKRVRINLNVPLRIDTKQEEDSANRVIEDERRFETEAAIVRVMKTRKVVNHNELISEVVRLLQSRFKPTISLIKIRIEDLIRREYLRREEGKKDVYHYIA